MYFAECICDKSIAIRVGATEGCAGHFEFVSEEWSHHFDWSFFAGLGGVGFAPSNEDLAFRVLDEPVSADHVQAKAGPGPMCTWSMLFFGHCSRSNAF